MQVGEWFYLVTSTFAYFPGIPVFRSNLAQWEQIGNILTRESQLPLQGCEHNEGIYAPTLRWHEGTFYLITTNVSGGGNFIVTAKNPQVHGQNLIFWKMQGIDPSLFFDEDGTCYYIGQRENSRGGRYNGDCEIWIQKLDLQTFRLEGEAHPVLYGFQRNAIWPEGLIFIKEMVITIFFMQKVEQRSITVKWWPGVKIFLVPMNMQGQIRS